MNGIPHQGNIESSMIEKIKAQSNYLRGRIAEELLQPIDYFTVETAQLLRFHGSYINGTWSTLAMMNNSRMIATST